MNFLEEAKKNVANLEVPEFKDAHLIIISYALVSIAETLKSIDAELERIRTEGIF